MRRTNCYCGLLAHANCTRCGNGVCRNHREARDVHSPWERLDYGQGRTLAEAAYARGYWSAEVNVFVCRDCRDVDGKRHAQKIAAQSRGWQRKTRYAFALDAAAHGYVITEGLTYEEAVQGWLSLNWQPVETIKRSRQTRPAKMRYVPRKGIYEEVRPAEYTQDQYQGWEFRRTAGMTDRTTITEMIYTSWSAHTLILTDGRVIVPESHPMRPPHRLIVEMSRKIFVTRGAMARWNGPEENWDN